MAREKKYEGRRYWIYWGHPVYKISGRAFHTLVEAIKWSKLALKSRENNAEEILIFKTMRVVMR